MEDLKKILTPQDSGTLDASVGQSWVPKEPSQLLLPYKRKEVEKEEETDVDRRRRKAKEVYDGYGKIIQDCKQLEGEIEEVCKNVVITIQPETDLRVMEAITRLFGTDGTKMTFQMYKAAINKQGELSKLPEVKQ